VNHAQGRGTHTFLIPPLWAEPTWVWGITSSSLEIQNRILAFYRGFLLMSSSSQDKWHLYPFMEGYSPEDGNPFHIGGVRSQKVYGTAFPS